jgi:hypothetical protein
MSDFQLEYKPKRTDSHFQDFRNRGNISMGLLQIFMNPYPQSLFKIWKLGTLVGKGKDQNTLKGGLMVQSSR